MKEILDEEIQESKIQVIYKVDIIIFVLACTVSFISYLSSGYTFFCGFNVIDIIIQIASTLGILLVLFSLKSKSRIVRWGIVLFGVVLNSFLSVMYFNVVC